MAISLTPFGFVFLPATMCALILRREWLYPLLIISACLHAPAAAVIRVHDAERWIGISPWLVVSAAITAHLAFLLIKSARNTFWRAPPGRLFLGWTAFSWLSIASAFVLPFVFSGMFTYNQELRQSIAQGTTPLQWRLINGIQAVNMFVVWLCFLYILYICRSPRFASRTAIGFAVAGALSLLFLLMHRADQHEMNLGLGILTSSLNPSYTFPGGDVGIDNFQRVNFPFSEPSYASVWFSGFFAAGLGVALFTPRVSCGLIVCGCAAIGIGNTLGGSGIASAAIFAFLAVGVRCFMALVKAKNSRRAKLSAFTPAILVLLVAVAITAQHNSARSLVVQIADKVLLPRAMDHLRAGNTRSASNRIAIRTIKQSYGLGVGLGSNRASSFLLNLGSNVGLIPTTIFLVLIGAQMLQLVTAKSTLASALAFGQAGMLLGTAIGIPDLNWPAFWIWILAGFGMATNFRVLQANIAAPMRIDSGTELEPQQLLGSDARKGSRE